MSIKKLHCKFFHLGEMPIMGHNVQKLRKSLFVDIEGWDLMCHGDREFDQFDTEKSVYCAMHLGDELIGSFRVTRCDHPYLSAAMFSDLATDRAFPISTRFLEISRFGLLPEYRQFSAQLYAAMFAYGWMHDAEALVAIADLTYERFLRRMGINTIRYGSARTISVDQGRRTLAIVAGEIPLRSQSPATTSSLLNLLATMELTNEAPVRRSDRLSA